MIQILEVKNQKILRLEEAKRHLRVIHNRDDQYINELIKIATESVENYVDYILIEKKVKFIVSDIVIDKNYFIGKFNQINVESLLLYDASDILLTEEFEYTIDSLMLNFSTLPATAKKAELIFDTKQTEYVDIPESFKQAALLMVGDMYTNRQNHVFNKNYVNIKIYNFLLDPYRKITLN